MSDKVVLFVGYSDNGAPVSFDSRLALFASLAEARAAAGAFGVGAAVPPVRVKELCTRYRLKLPELPKPPENGKVEKLEPGL